MGTFTSLRIISCLLLSAAMGAAGRVSAASLSDLGAFTQSSREVDRLFTDANRARTYREAIQSYASPRGDFSREFDAALEQLRKLRSQVGGVNERLLKARKPMAFQYSAPSKPTYRFERISHPLHAIWLLRQLHEANTDACSARDALLVDRWTPILDGASVFSVERDGRYTGITLTLVPVRSVKETYLLVVPHDSASRLPTPLLEAFLRDYRKREPKTLPFALLTNPEISVFQIERVDRDGRRAGRLGPIEGFRLVDPLAPRIVAAVPGWCNRSANLALGEKSGVGMENTARAPASANGVPILNPVQNAGSGKVTVDATVNIKTPGAASALNSGKNPFGQQPPSAKTAATLPGGSPVSNRVDNSQRSYRGGNTTIINGVAAPVSVATADGYASASANPSRSLPGAADVVGAGSVGSAGANRGPASLGTGAVSGPSGLGGGQGGGGLGNPLSKVDPTKLSPSDRAIYDAVKAGKEALDQGKPVPKPIGDVIARGALGESKDPNLKKAAKDMVIDEYQKSDNAAEAYQKMQSRIAEKAKSDPKEAKALIQQLKDDFCTTCRGCEYCVALEKKEARK